MINMKMFTSTLRLQLYSKSFWCIFHLFKITSIDFVTSYYFLLINNTGVDVMIHHPLVLVSQDSTHMAHPKSANLIHYKPS